MAMSSHDDHTLRRAVAGDTAAFGQVVDLCYDTIFRFAMQYTGRREDAEDVAQLACIKLARSIRSFRFEAAFSTWLYSLVLNCARDWQRQQRRHRGEEVEDAILSSGTDSSGESQIYLRQVLARVATMGEGFRETLVLVAGEGMSHAEAGALLGVKAATVSWRLHEIRKKLASAQMQEEFQ